MNTSLRIAVADDDSIMRKFIARAARSLGHHVVVSAADGRELVDRCSANSVDLVITDLRMPELDGIDAASELNVDSDTPVILVTGEDASTFTGRAGMRFVTTFLRKPIKAVDLKEALARAVQPSRVT